MEFKFGVQIRHTFRSRSLVHRQLRMFTRIPLQDMAMKREVQCCSEESLEALEQERAAADEYCFSVAGRPESVRGRGVWVGMRWECDSSED